MNNHQTNRRAFLKQMAAPAVAAAGAGLGHAAEIAPQWKNQIGLELYTVRKLLTRASYEQVIAQVAAIGYQEVEPADPYDGLEPAQYKALLDRHGLKMYSTHADAKEGPTLEKQLEGQQQMGIRYTAVDPAHREKNEIHTTETVKRSAERMNRFGVLLKKFGMKYYVHNHTGEFELLEDHKTTTYDVLLKYTDPELVAMQLDIGWACVAGQDPIAMFHKTPGRFELWHVKDAKIRQIPAGLTPHERAHQAKLVAVGEGDIDYKTIFENAGIAGLKHFVVEQDSAGEGKRSALGDCRVSYRNLYKILS